MDEAAKVLRMSFVELDEHPRKTELMQIAANLSRGTNDGEINRELNPEYARKCKDLQEQRKRLYG